MIDFNVKLHYIFLKYLSFNILSPQHNETNHHNIFKKKK